MKVLLSLLIAGSMLMAGACTSMSPGTKKGHSNETQNHPKKRFKRLDVQ